MSRLVGYPYVLVRLRCRICTRAGAYRLARLAEKFGAQAEIDDVVRRLAADCPNWKRTTRWPDGCGVYLPDLQPPSKPPDLPVLQLKVVK